ncbi:MAG TPA: hypothetical protein VN310_03215 [Candidatus Dormibacteraeota bacterium]|jgi:hypothetical protein|nr:hypothetical protein [Candidatus Dormibacteraeota bacterium]
MTMRIRTAAIVREAASMVAAVVIILTGGAFAQTPKVNRVPGNIEWVRLVEHATTCGWLGSRTEGNSEASNVPGCIRGADQLAGPIKVEMQAVYAGKNAETKANKSGEFLFKDVPASDYVLLATQGPKVLSFTIVRLPLSTSRLVLDVGPRFPAYNVNLYVGEY